MGGALEHLEQPVRLDPDGFRIREGAEGAEALGILTRAFNATVRMQRTPSTQTRKNAYDARRPAHFLAPPGYVFALPTGACHSLVYTRLTHDSPPSPQTFEEKFALLGRHLYFPRTLPSYAEVPTLNMPLVCGPDDKVNHGVEARLDFFNLLTKSHLVSVMPDSVVDPSRLSDFVQPYQIDAQQT